MEHGIARSKGGRTASWSFHTLAGKAYPRLHIHQVDGNPFCNNENHISKVRRKPDRNGRL
jgi:hypothetical protein